MDKGNTKLTLVLAFLLVLSGFASAEVCGVQNLEAVGDCIPQVYDSCYLCMNTNVDSSTGLSTYVTQLSGDASYYEPVANTVCGPNSYYIDSNTGVLKLKTPSLPFTGNYTLRFYYGIGTPNDIGTEDFTVKCGGDTFYFIDNDDIGSEMEFRFGEVECKFNSGYNYVEFKSIDMGSVHFKKFKITGESTCPVPPTPYCGDNVCNGLETCNTCSSDCGICPPPTPYCGDNVCNGDETCSNCACDCGICPPPTPYCGDNVCNGLENCNTCSSDCGICPPPTPYCGDNVCNGDETCSNCACDCGLCPPPTPYCGDDVCNGLENCNTCSEDCGICPPPTPYCGDDVCNGDETCSSCSCDCGSCHHDDDDEDECDSCKKTLILDDCQSDWKCSGWSECYEGIMTRDCVDENHCDIQYNKPYETSACTSVLPAKVIEDEKTCKYWWIWIIVAIVLLIILIKLLG